MCRADIKVWEDKAGRLRKRCACAECKARLARKSAKSYAKKREEKRSKTTWGTGY